jgi:hypothetical protein
MRWYPGHRKALGLVTVSTFALYLLSDVFEVLGGGFSALQLLFTFAVEVAIPLVVVGLCMAQRPRLTILGQVGALVYAYSYVFVAFTTLYALVGEVPNHHDLIGNFGLLFVANTTIMALGGIAFAVASSQAEVFPHWTTRAVMLGVVLVAATQAAPDVVRLLPVALLDVGFIGMGVLLLRSRQTASADSGEIAPIARGVPANLPVTMVIPRGMLDRRSGGADRRRSPKDLAAAGKSSAAD